MENNLDSITDPFEREYFKVKEIEIIEQVAIMRVSLIISMNMMMKIMGVPY